MNRPSDMKCLFNVYYNHDLVGQTMAISDRQAINSVRHNLVGETMSQYRDPGAWLAIETYKEEGEYKAC